MLKETKYFQLAAILNYNQLAYLDKRSSIVRRGMHDEFLRAMKKGKINKIVCFSTTESPNCLTLPSKYEGTIQISSSI